MTIYYRYWAQIQGFGPNQKVLLSVGIFSIILALILKITYRLWRGICFLLSLKIRIGWYLLISNFYYDTLISMKHLDGGRKIRERQNLFSEKNQQKYEKTKQAWETVKDGTKKFSLSWGLLIYLIFTCSILLPRYVKFYLPVLSEISLTYGNIEQQALKAAQAYEPFWRESEETAEASSSAEAEQIEDEEPPEIWLRLSEKGRDGSNVREAPDKNSGKIIVISGELSMKQLEVSEDEKWIRIELEDGTQGWINHTLVEVIE